MSIFTWNKEGFVLYKKYLKNLRNGNHRKLETKETKPSKNQEIVRIVTVSYRKGLRVSNLITAFLDSQKSL